MTNAPRFRLLQAREPDEPVRREEHLAFAARLGCDPQDIVPLDLLSGAPSVDEITAGIDIVLVGGSGRFGVLDDTPWMPAFVDTMGELAQRQFPTFASCFGFQALVLALGGEVISDPDHTEVGTYDITVTPQGATDPLFGDLPARFAAQLGHKDRATDAPRGAVHLAGSERCPIQAIRVGPAVYATQFHPELAVEDNRKRFIRYLAEYRSSMNQADLTDGDIPFEDSTHAEGLLSKFVRMICGPPGHRG